MSGARYRTAWSLSLVLSSSYTPLGNPSNKLAFFTLEDALSVWSISGKNLLFVWLTVSSKKTGARRIIRLDELSSAVLRSVMRTSFSDASFFASFRSFSDVPF